MRDTDNPSTIYREDDDQTAIAKFFDEMNVRIAGGRDTPEESRRRLAQMRPSLQIAAAADPHRFVEVIWELGPKYLEEPQ